MATPTHARLPLSPAQENLSRKASGLLVAAGLLWPIQALAIAWAVSSWAAGDLTPSLPCAAAFLLAALLKAGLEIRAGALSFRLADTLIHDQRQAILARESRLLRADVSSAEIGALLSQKLPLLSPYVTRYRPAMMRVRVLPLVMLALIFSISWAAGLVLLVAGPLIPVFMALVGMAAKEASIRHMAEIGDMNRLLIDRIAALPDLHLLNAQTRSRDDFTRAADSLRQRTMAVLRVAFLSSTVLELFAAIGVAMVAVYVGFSLLGEIPFGAYATPLTLFEGIFLLLLAPEYFQPLRDLAAAWHDKAGAEAVLDELDTLSQTAPAPILGQGLPVPPLPGAATLRLQGVSVQRGARSLLLPDLSLAPGDSLALTGPSGAGKSTMLDVISGLLPAKGTVTVCGQPLTHETADAWRARLALVPQEAHVPDVTLAQFLDPQGHGRDPAKALRLAQADGIVAALPHGMDTRLGETGAGVSGGELRRLLLARAFLNEAQIILADEPTADLDTATAGRIISALQAAANQGKTVIAATHDPALIAALVAVQGREIRLEPCA
ncbi:ABC transporter ATP-binding protein/permease [Thalassovita sp.]|uniref:ABC transporter ATP-binding protein/permease n=1 Tax=Thalassovita sp. TaxID=1979401 RepID=UPI00288281A6|nr:ATP-binding cassette domain-containing protein [Thalassovita sp.]MDF1801545.1 ATP-binding cassette domain-containing protein [Thalassovita sp.]